LFAWLDRFQRCGATLMRVVLGAIMTTYGYHKVIPHGALDNFIHFVRHLGLPAWLGYVAAFTEFFGGMLLIVGLLTRLVAFLVVIDLAVAIYKVNWHSGPMGNNSFFFPLACLAIALMLVFTGSGCLALDDLFGRNSGGMRPRAR
jgi:putative oxidoreductase